VAAGDLAVRVEPPNLLELGRLGLAFNQMTAGLLAARRELDSGESRRRELERRLRHTQALRAIGQVAASLAHEIASPLSTILGWARLLRSETSIHPEFREQTSVVAAQCERITRIVQRLLNVSRFPAGNRIEVKLNEVVLEVAAFLRPECNARGISLRTEIEDDTLTVLAERDGCLQIVINLCLNAIHAQPGGGVLILSLSRVLHRFGNEERWGARLEVRDAGPGILRERRAALFEPFYSARADGSGLGLGLAIVRDIVKEIDGEIEIDDAREGGACFRVYLPPAQRVEAQGTFEAKICDNAPHCDSLSHRPIAS
jgi:signal transduction histidine kinase